MTKNQKIKFQVLSGDLYAYSLSYSHNTTEKTIKMLQDASKAINELLKIIENEKIK